jgi:two-component system, chemotaxis family, sensor kinase CheA
MDNFKRKFVEEALDLINELETVLLRIEPNTEDKELIEHIFRIMHTLKGNSKMFGFDLIDQYTHQLETIYDLIRNGKMKVTETLMDLTLASVDHIRNLLDEGISASKEVQETHKDLLEKIKAVIEGKSELQEEKKEETAAPQDEYSTFYIHFQPDAEILANGTNPLFLVEDFKALGDYLALPSFDQLPPLNELSPEKCYTSWEIILSTKESVEKIYEIFIFAEDSCTLDIQKLSDENWLADTLLVNRIKEFAVSYNHGLGIQKIKELAVPEEKEETKSKITDLHAAADGGKLKNISNIRVSSEKLDELINLVSELVTTQAGLSLMAETINDKELLVVAEDVEKLVRRLRDSTFAIRLIPIENMMTRFQRLVRELSHELKKEITFHTEGTEIELDKNMIEGLIDPIMHIIRNSIDHGIEKPEERKKLGKPEKGTISFRAFHSGSNVFIQIADDGAGIDLKKVRKNAIARNLIQPETVMTDKELIDLTFLPGFSTAEAVTNISGRGVGMDVVKRKISDLRGEISIETKLHEGTTITVKLPLTLSIIDGLLVSIDKAYFVIPLSSVNKCFEFKHETLLGAINNMIFVSDGHIPFIYLRNEFGFSTQCPDLEQVVVIEYGDARIGLTVDKVIGEYQAVLKSLGVMFKKQDIISGATILGDGTVALVVDSNKIISQFDYLNQKSMK